MATLNPQPDCIDLELLPAAPLVPNVGSIRMYATQAGELAAIKADGSSALGGGNPGGADTEVQFNDGGTFGGDANLTWDKTTGSFNAQSASGLSSVNLDGVNENVTLTASGFISFSAVGGAEISSTTELDLDSSGAIQIGLQPACQIGFFNTPAIAKPTVTGAKAGNAALTSVILALKNLGLITDSTT